MIFCMTRLLSSCYLILCLFLFSCGTSEKAFRPDRKYSPAVLREDYQIFRNVLEAWHPSLYWYTPKDSMNYFFAKGYSALNDSMTEPEKGKKIITRGGNTFDITAQGWNAFAAK